MFWLASSTISLDFGLFVLRYQATWQMRSYGPGRAAVGDGRHRQHEHAAVGHGLDLPGQLHRLRPRLPRVEHLVLVRGQPLHLLPLELDAGRDDEPVVLELALADAHAPASGSMAAAVSWRILTPCGAGRCS